MTKGGRASKGVFYLLTIVLICGLIGSALGEILSQYVADTGLWHNLLAKGVKFGLQPPGNFDLKVLNVTLGFSVHLNLLGTLGLVLGLLLYKVI